MDGKLIFTQEERLESYNIIRMLLAATNIRLEKDEREFIVSHLREANDKGLLQRDAFGFNPVLTSLQTALIVTHQIGLGKDSIIATLLYNTVEQDYFDKAECDIIINEDVTRIIHGLSNIKQLYSKNPVIESENFRNLLLSFVEDMRVVLIIISERVNLMRHIRDNANTDARKKVSEEASYLYAPLAHKLGLYQLKSELEDLSLKYLEHDAYYMIKEKLNETKKSRDQYIDSFIYPIKQELASAGFDFQIKGRTKSIHSIWQKMKKQHCDFNAIFDLFAIRIILKVDEADDEKKFHALEKKQCWQVFSIITDMYQPNPKRLRDWLSMPKINGYESLHITVLGPQSKWVEVQIRTERMDEVAEKGVAAHWRYKGLKREGGLDEWLGSIRSAIENSNDLEVMDEFKMNLYEDEIYVFSPKGDLFKLPKGATVLDFAYSIHTAVGNTCTGARINNKIVNFRHVLQSGDQIEIITSSKQNPKHDWLSYVITSHAKSKIRAALRDSQAKESLMAKEMLERRFKNRKIELEESIMNQLVKKMGYKQASDFYHDIVIGAVDLTDIIERYEELRNQYKALDSAQQSRSAGEFNLDVGVHADCAYDDVLVIDKNVKGIDYQLARCCNPIYGDDVFGFVTVNGGIKIHRKDCKNAPEMRRRFGYRIVRAQWSGKGVYQYSISLRVIGNDDIGIVSNITSIISKDEKILTRSINIDSHDGLFKGVVTVNVDDTKRLERLIKKLKTVKGIKSVERI